MGKEEVYFAIVTTIVGTLGIIFTCLQFILAINKIKDDLFNLRYEFYRSVSNIWIATYDKGNAPLDITDLMPISEKAEFLFGKEASKHILSLENKRATHALFPDDDFSKPFRKYLKLTWSFTINATAIWCLGLNDDLYIANESEKYLKVFKTIFERSKHIEHYNMMMGISPEVEEPVNFE